MSALFKGILLILPNIIILVGKPERRTQIPGACYFSSISKLLVAITSMKFWCTDQVLLFFFIWRFLISDFYFILTET